MAKKQYEDLTNKLKKELPFSAFPIRELIHALQKKGHSITLKTELMVRDVYNSGDVSGIICTIEQKENKALACALTHLNISSEHPLFSEITDYQKKRNKRIKRLNQITWN